MMINEKSKICTKVCTFINTDIYKLERNLNNFLAKPNIKYVDLKISIDHDIAKGSTYGKPTYSYVLIYNETENIIK